MTNERIKYSQNLIGAARDVLVELINPESINDQTDYQGIARKLLQNKSHADVVIYKRTQLDIFPQLAIHLATILGKTQMNIFLDKENKQYLVVE
jgi:hypothetical protein